LSTTDNPFRFKRGKNLRETAKDVSRVQEYR
jgi:hypothetical protein